MLPASSRTFFSILFGRVRQSPKVAHPALVLHDHNCPQEKEGENLLAKPLRHSSLISHSPPSDAHLLFIPHRRPHFVVSFSHPTKQNAHHWLLVASDCPTIHNSSILGNAVTPIDSLLLPEIPQFAEQTRKHLSSYRHVILPLLHHLINSDTSSSSSSSLSFAPTPTAK